MKRVPRSLAWRHFKRLNAEFAKCYACSTIIKTPSSTTSGMRSHLSRKHPEIFQLVIKKKIVFESSFEEPCSKRLSSSRDDSAVSMTSNSSLAMETDPTSFVDVNRIEQDHSSAQKSDLKINESFSVEDEVKKVKKSFLKMEDFILDDNSESSDPFNKLDSFSRSKQLEKENSKLKKKVDNSSSEIGFLRQVNFLLIEMKELKKENEELRANLSQIDSKHQNDIEQLKVVHQKQMSKITSLIETFKYCN